mmetsp:Transcript_91197/g.282068  ORF Transcript_91197/g.282068 Transcript_91197/m.282068 type:complete len:234 (+) Transcript_91197:1530-2231(+)
MGSHSTASAGSFVARGTDSLVPSSCMRFRACCCHASVADRPTASSSAPRSAQLMVIVSPDKPSVKAGCSSGAGGAGRGSKSSGPKHSPQRSYSHSAQFQRALLACLKSAPQLLQNPGQVPACMQDARAWPRKQVTTWVRWSPQASGASPSSPDLAAREPNSKRGTRWSGDCPAASPTSSVWTRPQSSTDGPSSTSAGVGSSSASSSTSSKSNIVGAARGKHRVQRAKRWRRWA